MPAGMPKDVLDDLCSRFLVNLPPNERDDNIRICFQIEQVGSSGNLFYKAHWFYMDYYVVDESMPECQPIGLRDFIRLVFHHCSFLRASAPFVDGVIDLWRDYKQSVPVYGCVLLDETLDYVLLVQGYYAKNSWGFPKGKVNEAESPMRCACREAFEETGFDPSDLVDPHSFICQPVGESLVQLYVAPGVPMDYPFKPCTRNEIKKIQWFKVDDLPTNRSDTRTTSGLMAKQLWTVMPFINYVKIYINAQRKQRLKRHTPNKKVPSGAASAFRPTGSGVNSPARGAALPAPVQPPCGPVYSVESPVDFAANKSGGAQSKSSNKTDKVLTKQQRQQPPPPVVIGEIPMARAWQQVDINWKYVVGR